MSVGVGAGLLSACTFPPSVSVVSIVTQCEPGVFTHTEPGLSE
jgi:hypothetical protein